jgi:N-acyl-D-aspartate/D-glutamate deacylase
MAHDLIIAGGLVVDGTGAPPRQADLAISGGKIVELGSVAGPAAKTIDAKGAIVTPGFVDIHGHYDGQISWDDEIAPSSHHGVTTVVMGSCGVGFAPVRVKDRERLIQLMEGVEDIPGSALSEGIDWKWETFGEYLDALSARPRLIDVGAMVPHDALRVFAMGERAAANVEATDAEMSAMKAELASALRAGAFGFSTGRSDNHRAVDGSATPASEVTARELTALAGAFDGLGHRVLQAVSDFDMARSKEAFDGELELLLSMARAAKRPLSISVMQRTGDSEQWRKIFDGIERANREGLTVRAQVAPRGIGVLLGLEATFHPFMGFPTYKRLSALPLEQRVKELAKPEVKAAILSEKSEPVAGDGSPIPPLADQLLANLDFVTMSLFKLGDDPNYEPRREDSLFGEAMRRGVRPLEVVYDAMLESGGKALLYFPIYNYASGSLDEVGQMLRHPLAMMGLSDGGAHVGTICDASFPTFLLSHWVKGRASGNIALEQAVKMLTSTTASWMGLDDRGVLALGKRADVNVIDLDHLKLKPPSLVRDLPAGGRRFLQEASGYRATIVRGEIVRQDGATTAARPGTILRAKAG